RSNRVIRVVEEADEQGVDGAGVADRAERRCGALTHAPVRVVAELDEKWVDGTWIVDGAERHHGSSSFLLRAATRCANEPIHKGACGRRGGRQPRKHRRCPWTKHPRRP